MNQTPHPAAHPTQTELIRAAIALFGTAGFGATSTRAIAARAGTNISSISYHFGGKDGLRLACADALV
ncbi:TetR family transcriptional regulator, partial [Guyparkeria sp. 1SP6A2]|nr:TetR family transcriptional regulator [Guyparkeria sp. 1SP6A2]